MEHRVREAPRMRVFHELSPICERSESLLRDPEVGFSKSYSVTAPSIEPAEMEKKFRSAAETLGLTVVKDLIVRGLQAKDGNERSAAFLNFYMVTVVSQKALDAGAELKSLLAKGPTELGPLADGLGGIGGLRAAALKEREGALMEMTFSFASRPSSDVDAVAKRNGFVPEHEAWLKRASKPGEWSISVDSSSDAARNRSRADLPATMSCSRRCCGGSDDRPASLLGLPELAVAT